MKIMGAEQRSQKRVKLALPVYVTLLDDQGPDRESGGRLHDLSAGGCSFYADHEIPVGTRVHVRITLDEQLQKKFRRQELNARGAICRISHERDGFLLSLRFLPPEDASHKA